MNRRGFLYSISIMAIAARLAVPPKQLDQVALYFDGNPLIQTTPDGIQIMANRYSRALARSMELHPWIHAADGKYKRVIYPIAWQGPTLEDVASGRTESPNPAEPLRMTE